MPKARVNGISVAYDDAGPAGKTLLLLHGHPFDRSMWRPQAEPLARLGWRVVAPDLRGYGSSSVAPGKTSLSSFARDAVGLLDILAADSAVFAGHSLGGHIAMEVSRLFPERVEALILASVSAAAETDSGRILASELALRLTQEGMDRYALETLPQLLGRAARVESPQLSEQVLAMIGGAPPAGAAAGLRGSADRPDHGPALKALGRPALIVIGDEDRFTAREDAKRLHAFLADSELVVMKGVGHLPNLERPDAFNRAAARLLQRVAGERPPRAGAGRGARP